MPRKRKGSVFKGTPGWKKSKTESNSAQVTDDNVNNAAQLDDLTDDPGSSSTDSNSQNLTERSTITVSERKLKASSVIYDESEASTSTSESCHSSGSATTSRPTTSKEINSGYRLIDLNVLNDALKVAHKCKGGKFRVFIYLCLLLLSYYEIVNKMYKKNNKK